MNLRELYDETSPESIESYSQGLINKSFEEILFDYFGDTETYIAMRELFNNPRRKGSLGNLIEEYYFGYAPNSNRDADFPEAGVELKVMPYEKTKSKGYRAGERLVIGMIPNNMPVADSFYQSHVFAKLNLILLVLYLRKKNEERITHKINYSRLFSLSSSILEKDYEIIKSDYEIIVDKIKTGKAHELSEADTMYLGASTKGASASKSLQPQFYNPDIPAKRRAFSLKQGYMSSIINNYILEDIALHESITEDDVTAQEFEDIVKAKILNFKGYSEGELRQIFNMKAVTNKSIFHLLTLAMLGIKSNTAEEFVKSNTIIKTIRIETNGALRESMSFPAMNFKEFVLEEWENSAIYEYFTENRFLFVIYRNDGNEYRLENVKFWHMPLEELEQIGYPEWLTVQQIIKDGVEFIPVGNRVLNNLPKLSKTRMFHLRPHANKAAYLIAGEKMGAGSLSKDADELPNGDWMTKQSFWLNNSYILEQINRL